MEYCERCEENYHMWDIVIDEQRYTPREGHSVLDLGGWYGHFTLYCASRGALVKTYEPVPAHYARLTDKLRKEPWANRVEAVQRGVSAAGGKRDLWTNPVNSRASSLLRESGNGEKLEIDTDSLAEALGGGQWDCVKVDIEGSEWEVFRRADPSDLMKIRYLTMELHNDVLTQEQHDELVGHLTRHFPFVTAVPEMKHSVETGRICKLFLKNEGA